MSIQRGLLLAAVLLGSGCSSLSVYEQRAELASAVPDKQYQFESLPSGMQSDPELEERVVELSSGRSYYKGYQLPLGHQRSVLQLRTYIDRTELGEGFFYPVVELFDVNGKRIEIIKPQLLFTQLSSKGRYAAVPIELGREVSRFVIRTEPKLYDQDASYTTQHQGSSWSYSVTPFAKRRSASYLPLGKLELLTPDEGQYQPFEKMSGGFWQFSASRGGEELVSGGDYYPNMTLGGGPAFSIGYAWAVPGRRTSTIRTSIGAGYYSLDDGNNISNEQSYLTTDVLWVESNHVSSIGFGVTARAAHELSGASGNFEYDPAFGPKLVLEIRGSMGVSLGAYLSWLTFTDHNSVETKSNQAGLYLMKLY